VGETGPELVRLPRGSRVSSSEQTKLMKQNATVNVNFYGDLKLDSESRVDELVRKIELAMGNNANLNMRGI
jgi:ribosome-binding factor A